MLFFLFFFWSVENSFTGIGLKPTSGTLVTTVGLGQALMTVPSDRPGIGAPQLRPAELPPEPLAAGKAGGRGSCITLLGFGISDTARVTESCRPGLRGSVGMRDRT